MGWVAFLVIGIIVGALIGAKLNSEFDKNSILNLIHKVNKAREKSNSTVSTVSWQHQSFYQGKVAAFDYVLKMLSLED